MHLRGTLFLALLHATGCLTSPVEQCAQAGLICPPGLVCAPGQPRCVLPAQLLGCGTDDDGNACDIAGTGDGFCSGGICIPRICGDGVVSEPEQCDPAVESAASCEDFGLHAGKVADCDPSTCTWDTDSCARCGDGIHDEGFEECDGELGVLPTCLEFGFDVGSTECSDGCFADRSGCSYLGWRPSDFPYGNDSLRAVWYSTSGQAIVAGSNALTYHYDGLTWTPYDVPADSITDMVGWSSQSAAAVFGSAVVSRLLLFDGSAWQEVLTSDEQFQRIWGSAADDFYVVALEGISHHDGSLEPDGSPSLTGITELNEPEPMALAVIDGTSADNVWVAGRQGSQYPVFHWDGLLWESVGAPADRLVLSIAALDGGKVAALMAFAGASEVYLYDGGWSLLLSSAAPLSKIAGTSASDLVLVGEGGELLHWNGTQATEAAVIEGRSIRALVAPAPGMARVVGASGADFIYSRAHLLGNQVHEPDSDKPSARAIAHVRTEDAECLISVGDASDYGALTVTDLTGSKPPAMHFRGLLGSFSDVVAETCSSMWLVTGNLIGSPGIIYFDGRDFTLQTSSAAFSALWRDEASGKLVAVGSSGSIAESSDGRTWVSIDPVSNKTLLGVWGRSATDVYAVGRDGTVLHFDGMSWSDLSPATTDDLYDVVGTPDKIIVVGEGGAVWTYDGSTWETVNTSTAKILLTVAATTDDDVWVAGADGVILTGTLSGGLFPVRSDSFVPIQDMTLTSRTAFFATGLRVHALQRTRFWNCESAEATCGDGGDDDCDGLPDSLDLDCQ